MFILLDNIAMAQLDLMYVGSALREEKYFFLIFNRIL